MDEWMEIEHCVEQTRVSKYVTQFDLSELGQQETVSDQDNILICGIFSRK